MRKRICCIAMLVMVLSGCGQVQDGTSIQQTEEESSAVNVESWDTNSANPEASLVPEVSGKEGDEQSMKILFNGTEYDVVLEKNVTSDEIVEKLPLSLTLVRYAGHEYYSELPFTPAFSDETTSNIKAGHIYYWGGWNAFVINFEDYDISPYKVVHIGEIKSEDISDILENSGEKIDVGVR